MYEKRADWRIIGLAAVLVLVVIMGIFFLVVRPVASGYVVYKEIKASNQSVYDYTRGIDELKAMLEESEEDLTDCSEENKEFFSKLDELLAKTAECEQKRGALESQVVLAKDSYDKQIKLLEDKIKTIETELKDMKNAQNSLTVQQQNDYDVLAQNLANNLCCKRKVDNPAISHYRVENHRIVCLEEGSLKIVCP